MSLLVQFQCLFYAFMFGFWMSACYHIVNRMMYILPKILRLLVQICIGCGFGYLYYYGLVILNEGVLRGYFYIFIFMGYLFYQKFYAYYLLYYLEKCVYMVKRIIRPLYFFFHSINVIMKKRMKRVMKRWQKEEQ